MTFNPRESKSLSQWLEIATCGIAASGRERITREIGAHYAEAVEAFLAQGEPEPVAQARAIIALGDATVAAKRFRKNHFSEKEIELLATTWKNAATLRHLFYKLLFPPALFVICRLLFGAPRHNLYFIGFMFPLIGLPILSFLISTIPATKAKVSRLLLVELATDIFTGAAGFYWIMGFLGHTSGAYWGFTSALLPLAIQRMHLWNKARKLFVGADDHCVVSGPLPD
jgi:hypothetical protein